jgi:hypothetical protein
VAVIGPACETLALKPREPKLTGRKESRASDACAVGGVPCTPTSEMSHVVATTIFGCLVVDQARRE